MRSSVSLKVVTVLAIVLAMATIALFVVYDGLSRVGREMRQLAEIGEPSYSATNKIEINLNGMAHAVFAYLRNRIGVDGFLHKPAPLAELARVADALAGASGDRFRRSVTAPPPRSPAAPPSPSASPHRT